jgi:pimeloyl-ACP methyl ester carboxylesterase
MRVAGEGDVGLEVFLEGPEDGAPVLLMHGWPDSHSLWAPQIEALSSAGYRTIAPDLRGFGESDKPEDNAAYHVTHTVADMTAVLDSLGVDKATVIAHDWGAAAAWGLAAFVPDRVERLAALSVGHPAAFVDAGWEQRMRSWYMLLFNFEGVAEAWLSKFGGLMLASHPGKDEILQRWKDDERSLKAGLGWYRANAHPRSMLTELQIPNVQCPTLGVWSSKDVALTESQMTGSERYVDGPWRYERLEGPGHWMQLEAPEELNRILLEWLSSSA